MKLKRLLALLGGAFCFALNSAFAQTNYVAGWDGGNDTSSPSNFGWTSSANKTLQPRNNNGGIRMMTNYSGYTLEDGTAYNYSPSSDPSSVIFWLRYNTAGESFTYTFKGLEAGHIYKFSGLVGWHNNSDNPTFTVVLNDGTNTLATMSKTVSTKQKLYPINKGFTAPNTMTSETNVNIVFTCNKTGDCMEAVSALKLVEDFDAYQTTLEAKVTEANAITGKMEASVSTALSTAISNAQAVIEGDDHTSSTIISVLTPLTTAMDNANTSIAEYARLKSVIDNASGEFSTVTTAYDNGTVGDIVAAIATVRAATKTDAMSTPGTESTPANWTGVIANPSFEEYETLVMTTKGGNQNNPAGWTNSKTWTADAWNYAVKSTENATQGNNSFKIRFNWAADTYTLSQTVTDLPRGKYKMKVDVKNYNASGSKCNAKLSINSFETESNTVTEATTLEKEFFLTEDGNIEIKLTTTYILGTNSCEGILYWDNVTLTHYGTEAIEEAELTAAKEALSSMIASANAANATSVNSGSGAFQIPESAATKFAGAITDAQAVYDNVASTKTEFETATSTLEAAISTYQATELNAPESEKRYVLKNKGDWGSWTRNGQDWSSLTNSCLTFVKGGRKDQGEYGVSLGFASGSIHTGYAKNDAFAQAFIFTHVEGNKYTISQYDVDGNLRYITTAKKGYDEGSHQQIRTTTEAEKAYAFTIVPTTTAGEFNIYVEDASNNIDFQDEGAYASYYGHANFELIEASEASVAMAIKAGKYATRIFPFTPTLPEGIKAYRISAIVDKSLTLVEVAEPKANVPYLLKNETDKEYTGDPLIGYGTAAADSYTSGYLTGSFVTGTYVPQNSYVLQTPKGGKQGFYQVDAANSIELSQYRAYLTVTAPATGDVKSFILDGDETDGIRVAEAEQDGTETIYTLSGQRVQKAQKGIYIVNGKKVVIK